MIEVKLLQKLLNTKDAELRKIEMDRRRTRLRSLRYFVGVRERAINGRCSKQPFGSRTTEKKQNENIREIKVDLKRDENFSET